MRLNLRPTVRPVAWAACAVGSLAILAGAVGQDIAAAHFKSRVKERRALREDRHRIAAREDAIRLNGTTGDTSSLFRHFVSASDTTGDGPAPWPGSQDHLPPQAIRGTQPRVSIEEAIRQVRALNEGQGGNFTIHVEHSVGRHYWIFKLNGVVRVKNQANSAELRENEASVALTNQQFPTTGEFTLMDRSAGSNQQEDSD
jgi:hypothetical protein